MWNAHVLRCLLVDYFQMFGYLLNDLHIILYNNENTRKIFLKKIINITLLMRCAL